MENLSLTQVPIAKTGMLIRRPVSEVFEAFVNPEITSQFWFTKGSGRLEAGKQVQWEWEMYGFSIPITVKAIEADKRILIDWTGHGRSTTVEWVFTPVEADMTYVQITNSGFAGDGDSVAQQAADSSSGFSLVLSGLKAYLEHGIKLNLVADRFPAGLEER